MVQVPYHVLFITQNDKPKDAQGNWLFFIMLKKHGVQCTIIYTVIFDCIACLDRLSGAGLVQDDEVALLERQERGPFT